MNRRAKVGTSLAIGCVMAAAPVGSAAADRPIERGTFSESESFVAHLCGRDWESTATFEGRYMVRATDGVPLESFHEVSSFSIWHVAENGDAYETAAHRQLLRTTDIEHVTGNVYRITEQNSGNTWGIYSASGQAAWRDRGLWIQSFEIDTLGDNDPENDQFVDGSYEASWRGPHFISDTQPGSLYCQYVDDALAMG